MDKIVNSVYRLALEIQRRNPNLHWDVCCELAFQQNRLNNAYA